jgi:enamine deaminase RidA (YjgF/YER057c/UK114 family)
VTHRIVVAPELAEPTGYAHAVIAAPGRLVYLGGQTALGADGTIQGSTLVEQLDVCASNVVTALGAAGGVPEDLVSIQIFTTDVARYRANLAELGTVWRKHFGRHYPAMGLFGVTELFDEPALIELVCTAVVPAERQS